MQQHYYSSDDHGICRYFLLTQSPETHSKRSSTASTVHIPPRRSRKYSSITDAHLQHHPSLLLSGSEDGTARLWDLRTRKAAYCIVAPVIENEPNDVTAVAFHPSIIEDRQRSDESGDATISTSRLDCMV